MSDERRTTGTTRAGPTRLADVARLAGVSPATVSRVLSRPGMVADATRDAVMEAIRTSGYRLNHAARNLRKQRTGAIVALVPNLANPFFAKILAGMGRTLEVAGYDLLVADTQSESGRHRALARFLDPSRADGVILLDGLVGAQELLDLHRGPPLVMACEWIEGSDLPRVVLDNAAGAAMAAEHLKSLGHQRIACIGGPSRNVLHITRMQGVERVLGPEGFMMIAGDFTLESGNRAGRLWRELPPDRRPTGVISFSDEMACAFISDLQRHGFVVPRDVSVVGFDDIELVSHLTPALTTIRQPKREIGRLAATTILILVEGRDAPECVTIAPELMLRASTAPPNPGNNG